MKTQLERAREAHERAKARLDEARRAADELADDATEEEVAAAIDSAKELIGEVERTAQRVKDCEELEASKRTFKPSAPADADPANEKRDAALPGRVKEPDMYRAGGPVNFMTDLYNATVKRGSDPAASDRIARHQAFEVEKRAVSTTTLGGIIPPQYLVDLYAKAARNGRVFADQVNHQTLPDVGMSIVIPRLTVGLTAGVQATENATVTTSDPTEVDLTVPVRTLAGYSPVSRQALERQQYDSAILFEDLLARYWALLDTQCINGSGASGQILGLLGTSGIATSTLSTATVVALFPKIADLIQQVNTSFGGLGYVADKIVMHPRRWGAICAALDGSNRPLVLPSNFQPAQDVIGQNVMGYGGVAGYGYVGQLLGLAVYVDANIPTNLGAGTNEDRVIVMASQVSHLWERTDDPMTLSFEQTTGTSLQVNLVCYGYAAFTAGRYPGACGVISGTGLVPPTF